MTALGRPASHEPRQPLLVCAAVALLTPVLLVLLERWWGTRGIRHVTLGPVATHLDLYALVLVIGVYVGYAVVLAVWGRTPGQRVAGAVCALTPGLFIWGLYVFFEHLLWNRPVPGSTSVQLYGWLAACVPPLLVALAWGLARRRGRRWLVGLAVAPLLAGADHWLTTHSGWWFAHVAVRQRGWVGHDVRYLVPIVAACLVCWALDRPTSELPAAGA